MSWSPQMKIRFTDTLHQDEPTLFSIERCDTMRDTRQNVISLTEFTCTALPGL